MLKTLPQPELDDTDLLWAQVAGLRGQLRQQNLAIAALLEREAKRQPLQPGPAARPLTAREKANVAWCMPLGAA